MPKKRGFLINRVIVSLIIQSGDSRLSSTTNNGLILKARNLVSPSGVEDLSTPLKVTKTVTNYTLETASLGV
ncbi:hypothetical protein Aoki45_36890 [Algoriphagus sp. oki45]|nr:hypothetical protein Aoki45_36890 [Algoriphagus sp. oki45]